MKKLKFYAIGFVPGLLIVFFILNKKGASCSGYLPNSRVIAESLSKEFKYSEEAKNAMATYKIDEKFIKDSIITNGKVDFDRSHAQKKPCPDYLLTYPEKNPSYEITYEKCEETVTVNSLKKLK
ncbi:MULTISPECIES: DUF4258 domain-containing protein [Chryseobacterium]|uniref:DUF4258 domain-containing protein n=1 Tax=Chryseobacterium cucumeris TaxID=1813611 RepID=A0ABX9XAC8_9FLAO|nr:MULTISPECIES: DUF4258 domain-containing protein [Chryseobacterium]KYH08152.1 hypothetical protein A1704_05675 [Chryseobacterium cucumeris]MDH5034360.1 DUF4258 domain-containing protein [Chryseobacterium cucumeris]PWW28066.1 hypothetical protein DEU40_105109 [Chryseobacterium sp. AG844]QWT87769.1 DUF4258 domain-containing protein [Chryseobacterium sp. PCH239]ROH95244.1 DUF4258 domain-containing protein [Chryseobacterium cucumeris]